jgi:type II secretory pathway pseudopilin PulG
MAEILAAMLFLAILVPAVVEGLSLSNRAAVVAERSSMALQLAERQLSALVLDGSWSSANLRGDFGVDWPGYRWELSRGSWAQDDMTELTLSVLFEVQGRERSVRLTTLVDDSAL